MTTPSYSGFAMLGVAEIIIILMVLAVFAAIVTAIIVIATKLLPRDKKSQKPEPVPTVPASCPRCGTYLGPDAPQGLCPRCVMAAGFETRTETQPVGDEDRDQSG